MQMNNMFCEGKSRPSKPSSPQESTNSLVRFQTTVENDESFSGLLNGDEIEVDLLRIKFKIDHRQGRQVNILRDQRLSTEREETEFTQYLMPHFVNDTNYISID